jgi:cysteinyl-tRNA synthetase
MKLYNTLSRQLEEVIPFNPPKVGMYACGPTVYWSTHIGHMSKYVGDDILRRVLTLNGFAVKHVMNITDVGHLTSDADEGEDKMEKGAARENLSVWELAKKYEREFFETMAALNVLRPDVVCRATEYIPEQIALIKRLQERGFVYQTAAAVYFDVAKFPEYGRLAGQKLEEKITGARDEVVSDPQKKNPYDFALWMKCVGRFEKHIMRWDSPWGVGFPGWHIECSAMSMKNLGEQFEIHTGGVDHIGVHHPAEIAQSEAATGKKPFVKYWVHRAFILVDGKKMSKSLNNFYELEDVRRKGFEPLALRYFFLTGHYRQPLNFTWEALENAQNSLGKLRQKARTLKTQGGATLKDKFLEALNDDLNTPRALAVAWQTENRRDLEEFDQVLGLDLFKTEEKVIPEEILALLKEREAARQKRDFAAADKIRELIISKGYDVSDAKISQ